MRRCAPLTALPTAPGWSLERGKEGENLGEMGRKERARGKERERKRRGGKENGTKGREGWKGERKGRNSVQCVIFWGIN